MSQDVSEQIHTYGSQVLNFDVDIPELFSFPINLTSTDAFLQTAKELFEIQIDLLNRMASGQSIPTYEVAELSDTLDQFDQSFATASVEDKFQNKEYLYCYVRVKIAEWRFFDLAQDKTASIEKLKEIITLLSNCNEKTDEIWWYLGSCTYSLSKLIDKYDHQYLPILLQCALNITSKVHQKTIIYWYLEYYKKLDGYPGYSSLLQLQLTNLVPFITPTYYEGQTVQQRHKFIMQQCQNPEFFDIQRSILIKNEFSEKITLEYEISAENSLLAKSRKISVEVTPNKLFKFMAHHIAPSPPILKITIKGMDPVREDQFNKTLNKKLRADGFVNSQGFWNNKVSVGLLREKAISQFTTPVIKELMMKALEETIDEFELKDPEEKVKYINDNFDLKDISKQVEQINAMRSQLSGMIDSEALFLFQHCLTVHQYGLPSFLVSQIKQVVIECLDIKLEAQAIHEENLSIVQKHDAWFNLAKNIVASYLNKPRHLLISIGTPIEEKDKSYSTHAIYVALKWLGNGTVQIIITNGGDKVSLFHQLSPSQHPKEHEEYQYAAFEPFNLSDPNAQEALTHYLYRAISIEYLASVLDDEENKDNPFSFINLLRSIYLRTKNLAEKESFKGNPITKEITYFKRQDLQEYFTAQYTGNCTVHNLEKALHILFDMNKLMYGLMGDTVVFGIDQLVTTLKTKLKLPELTENKRFIGGLSQTFLGSSVVHNSSQPTKLKRVWATKALMKILFPILDLFSNILIQNKVEIAKPNSGLNKTSPTGWQLFSVEGGNEYWATLTLTDQGVINALVRAINKSFTLLKAISMTNTKGNSRFLVIKFASGINLKEQFDSAIFKMIVDYNLNSFSMTNNKTIDPISLDFFNQALSEVITLWEKSALKSGFRPSLPTGSTDLKRMLTHQAKLFGFKRKDVKPDGNCFFHAVVHQLSILGVNSFDVASLKQQALDFIISHIDEYAGYFKDDKDTFINKLLNGEWADHIFIHATAKVLNLTIAIIHSNGSKPTIINKGSTNDTIYLGHEVDFDGYGWHYQSLIKDPSLVAIEHIEKYVMDEPEDEFEEQMSTQFQKK